MMSSQPAPAAVQEKPEAAGDLVLCGGSHLAAIGIPVSQALPIVLGRRLRNAGLVGRLRTIFYRGNPLELVENEKLAGLTGYTLVVIPRNMEGLPLPHHLTLLAARLRGQKLTLEDLGRRSDEAAQATQAAQAAQATDGATAGGSRPSLRVRARPALRWVVGLALAAVCVPALPITLFRLGRRLDAALAWVLANGCRHVVLATPIPLSWRHFPGASWHQAALGWLVRRRAGDRVTVADAYVILRRLPEKERNAPGDPRHLSAEGNRLLAAEIERALVGPASAHR